MGANIRVDIQSPHGGKTRMDLNPKQAELLVRIAKEHHGSVFLAWFADKIAPHADERPRS